MNPYSESLERIFIKIKEASSQELGFVIYEMVQTIQSIDNGNFFNEVKNKCHVQNLEDWLKNNNNKSFLSIGINLPKDKDEKLSILTQIFVFIGKQSNALDFIIRYFEMGLSSLARLMITGTMLFSTNQKKIEESFNLNLKYDIDAISKFHKSITCEFERLLLNEIELKYKHQKKIIMGDNFEHIVNSTVINKSLLQNSLNKYADNENIISALKKLEKIVFDSENRDAIDTFNNMNEELAQISPSKSKIKAFWNMLIDILPTIKNMTDIVATITSLF